MLTTTQAGQVVFAPDDPMLVYVALGFSGVGISHDAGKTWTIKSVGGKVWHLAVAPLEPGNRRRIYAAGDNQIFHSLNGGATWLADGGLATINASRQVVSDFQIACRKAAGQENPPGIGGFGGRAGDAVGSASRILAVEPGKPAVVYFATTGGANGPSYYNRDGNPPDGTLCNTVCARLAGEASLWRGDFTQFQTTGKGSWALLPGPPVYTGATTPSGNTFVITKPATGGFLILFSDNSHVHVTSGVPTGARSWHRLDGRDLSVTKQMGQHRNILLVHADPHALVTTPNFDITLQPATGVDPPFDQNSVLAQHLGGTIWMANDGGVYWSDDGGQTWNPAFGLETIDPVNIAGLFGLGNVPALYFGCGDNDDFFSIDGGATWGDPITGCGDCDAWFADVAQPTRVLELAPRSSIAGVDGCVNLITSPDPHKYPNPSVGAQNRLVPATRNKKKDAPRSAFGPYPSSGFVLKGFRPIIRTLATEAPLPDGDYVFIDFKDENTAVVMRTRAISSIAQLSDWDDPAKAQQIGPPLPAGANVVQASGGHQHPVFYVANGNGGNVWRLDESSNTWKTIVPGGPPGHAATFAFRFFVDPFRPDLIYLVDASGIKISLDGGQNWLRDPGLTLVASAAGLISSPSRTVIGDMIFNRGESKTRFAFGDAGVMCTVNGVDWFLVLDTMVNPDSRNPGFSIRCRRRSIRALYVNLEGRSILRVGGIPFPPPLQEEPVFDLLEFAAIIEA